MALGGIIERLQNSGGGSQTPWIQNIDGAGYSLTNTSYIEVDYANTDVNNPGINVKSTAGSGAAVYGLTTNGILQGVVRADTSGDLTLSAPNTVQFLTGGFYPSNTGTAQIDANGTYIGYGVQLSTSFNLASNPNNGYILTSDPFGYGTWQAPTTSAGLSTILSNSNDGGNQAIVDVYSIQLTNGATTGYVWTATDGSGNGSWQPAGGGTPSWNDTLNVSTDGGNHSLSNLNDVGACTFSAGLYYNCQGQQGVSGTFSPVNSLCVLGGIVIAVT